MGAIAISDLVKTTLGPKGMDKILQPMGTGKCSVTNDGATILENVVVDNAAAKIIIDISKTQDLEVGDGTTTVAVLAGELLREADKLINIQKFHPQVIIQGWRLAMDAAKAALEACAITYQEDSESFHTSMLNIAMTTLSSKLVTHEKEHFANMCVEAVARLGTTKNLDYIHIIKKIGG